MDENVAAVTIIICGTILLLAPDISGYLHQSLIVDAVRGRAAEIALGSGPMSADARSLVRLVGILMIVTGIVAGLTRRDEPDETR